MDQPIVKQLAFYLPLTGTLFVLAFLWMSGAERTVNEGFRSLSARYRARLAEHLDQLREELPPFWSLEPPNGREARALLVLFLGYPLACVAVAALLILAVLQLPSLAGFLFGLF